MSQEQRRRKVSTGDDILAGSMDAAFASLIRDTAAGLVRSGVLTDAVYHPPKPNNYAMNETAVVYEAQPSPEQQLELEQHRIALCNELEAMLTLRQVTGEFAVEIRDAIQSLATATSKAAMNALALNISNRIADGSQYTTAQTSLNDQEARERQQYLNDLNAYMKDSTALRDKLGALGYHDTPENEQKLEELRNKLGTLKEFSPEWRQTVEEIYKIDDNYFDRIEAQLRKEGKHELADEVRRMKEATQQGREKLKDISAEGNSARVGKAEETKVMAGKQDARAASFYDDVDDEPALTQVKPITKAATGMNDAQANALWAKVETHQPGSPEWLNTANELYALDTAYFQHVKEATAKARIPQEEMVELGNLSPTIVSNNTPSSGRGIG